jgi:hypothetical protein
MDLNFFSPKQVHGLKFFSPKQVHGLKGAMLCVRGSSVVVGFLVNIRIIITFFLNIDTDSFILGLYCHNLPFEMKKLQGICDFSNQKVGDYQSGFYSEQNSNLVGYLKLDMGIQNIEVVLLRLKSILSGDYRVTVLK